MGYVQGYSIGATGSSGSVALDVIRRANVDAARLLVPLHPAIDRLPLSSGFKKDLKERPVEAALELVRPIENLLADIIRRANQYSGRQVRSDGYPGFMREVQMDPDQPGDSGMPVVDRQYVRRLRIGAAFMTLVRQAPLHLTRALLEIFHERGIQGAQWLALFLPLVFTNQAAAMQMIMALSPQGLGDGGVVSAPVAAGGTAVTYFGFTTGQITAMITTGLMVGGALIPVLMSTITAIITALIKAKSDEGSSPANEELIKQAQQQNKIPAATSGSSIPVVPIVIALAVGGWLLTRKK